MRGERIRKKIKELEVSVLNVGDMGKGMGVGIGKRRDER